MVLVVGLGNPGKKYEKNRHNVGFMVVERLARSHGLADFKEKFSALWTKGDLVVGGRHLPVAVLKPQTFMNLSGDSVQPAAAFLKIEPASIVVVHDEIDIPWKDVRLKLGGGHAGNNGIRSVIARMGTPDFVRVRVGVGRPPPGFKGDVADYVLQNFDPMESAELPDVIDRAVNAVERVVADGLVAAMNAVNTKR
ncbi:MAG: aminoacyl-tRNA hydrolase [Labilithrix sp.]|nr:aminoacyl-tRNA hydrolase [Labilithrix sp.]MCW5816274.1 aminoacyl-tRNA hydrolase [Labilithrix sp.]